ncbi:MAG: hypothetical protein ACRDYD_11495, partial [Acidimicrobiales bacterium]
MSISASAWTGLIVGLLLLIFVAPVVARRVAMADGDPRMFRLVMWAAALKIAAAPLYIFVVSRFYGGIADAVGYTGYGRRLAAQIHQGNFDLHAGRLVGDGATRIAAGIVEAVVGPTELGTFIVFSFLAFLGLVLFYRAFRLALPDADSRRYAKLVFFLPSLVFWTAAASKDALTLLALGLAAYGGARLFNRQLRGFAWLAAGLALSALIRPHVALLAILTLAVAYPLGRAKRVTPVTPLVTLAGAAVFVVGGVVLAGLTVQHFHLHGLSLHSLHHILKSNAHNTGTAAQGQVGQFNSSVSASTSLSPAAFPRDFYDVVLRPLPFNAHGLTQLVSSLENVFLLGLLLTSLPRLWAALMSAPKRAYILSALLFSVVWII